MTQGVAEKEAVRGSPVQGSLVKVEPKPVTMKRLFMVRHAEYNTDGRVEPWQDGVIAVLAESIRGITGGGSAYIVSSTAPRALDSAKILAEKLGVKEFEQMPFLWGAPDGPSEGYYRCPDRGKLMKIIDERRLRADGLIVVTHELVIEEFHPYFLKGEFKKRGRPNGISVRYADGVCYNVDEKSFKIVR